MKPKTPRLSRALIIAYSATFIISLLWTALARPAEHTLCLLFHAALGITGGNLILHWLKDVSSWVLRRRDIFLSISVFVGVFVNIGLHVILH